MTEYELKFGMVFTENEQMAEYLRIVKIVFVGTYRSDCQIIRGHREGCKLKVWNKHLVDVLRWCRTCDLESTPVA